MSSFFKTKEFKTLKKIAERLEVKSTLKNVILYLRYMSECIDLCESEYDNVGFIEEEVKYRWMPFVAKPAKEEYEDWQARFLVKKFGNNFVEMLTFLKNGEGES